MSVTQDTGGRLREYQTEINGVLAGGMAAQHETTTEWLESTVVVTLEEWA